MIWRSSLIAATLVLAGTAAQLGSSGSQSNRSGNSSRTGAYMEKGILAITADHQGRLFVDGRETATLSPNRIATFSLVAGQHFVDLRDANGNKLWEKIVTISAGIQIAEEIKTVQEDRTRLPAHQSSPQSEAESPAYPKVFSLIPMDRCLELRLLFRVSDYVTECNGPPSQLAVFKNMLTTLHKDLPLRVQIHDYENEASMLFELGEYRQVLAKIDKIIEGHRYYDAVTSKLPLGNDDQSRLFSALRGAEIYSIRACARFVLRDYQGSLADFEESTRLYRIIRQLNKKPGFLEALSDQRRATVLYRLGLFGAASRAYQEFLSAEAYERGNDQIFDDEKQLGNLIAAASTRSEGDNSSLARLSQFGSIEAGKLF